MRGERRILRAICCLLVLALWPALGAGAEADGQYIRITDGDVEVVFALNDSAAAQALYAQLPLTLPVEDYGGNEKIFYPPEELDVQDAPLAEGPAGTLAYYAPWGDVAVFLGPCAPAAGLYALGEAVSGAEFAAELSGEITVEAAGEETAMQMNVQIGDSVFTATLENNAATEAFVETMQSAPLVVQMRDYGGFEKVGALGMEFPADDRRITTQAGDIVLYGGDQIVVFYGSNTWSYTILGRIDDLDGWEDALGDGDATVTFSMEP